MFGAIASAAAKTFAKVGQAAARVGRAVMGVGSSVVTAGASQAGLNGVAQSAAGSTLGNVLQGAVVQAGVGALVGGAIGAVTGAGFGKGALMGGAAGAVSGGLMGASGMNANPLSPGFGQQGGAVPADTPTGFAPTGSTDYASARVAQAHEVGTGVAPAATATGAAPTGATQAGQGGFGKFLNSELGRGLLDGLGKGYGAYQEAKALEEQAEANRDFLREQQEDRVASHDVGGALETPMRPDRTQRPTPKEKFGRWRYQYDPGAGRVVRVPA